MTNSDRPRADQNTEDTPGTQARHRLRRRLAMVGLLAGLTVWGLVDVRRRGRVDPDRPLKHMSDFTVYTEAGAAFFDGRKPYEVTNPRGWYYVYPPLFAMLVAPLAALGPQDQATVWFFVSLLVCWGCYRECVRILRSLRHRSGWFADRYQTWAPRLGAAALAAAALPALDCMQRGQVSVLKLYLVLLGFRLTLRARAQWGCILGGAVLSAAIVLKVVPVLPVAFVLFLQLVAVLARRPGDAGRAQPTRPQLAGRFAGSAVGVTLGLAGLLFVVPAALVGWNANLRHLGDWSQGTLVHAGGRDARSELRVPPAVPRQDLGGAVRCLGNWLDYTLGDGPNDLLVHRRDRPEMLMDAPAVGRALLWVRLGVVAGLLAAGLRLGAGGDALGLSAGLGLGCAAMLVVSPVSWDHYFLFLAPGALLVPLWLGRRRMPRAAAAVAVVPALLTMSHYLSTRQTARVGLLGLGTAAWAVAVVVLVVLGGKGRESPALSGPRRQPRDKDC